MTAKPLALQLSWGWLRSVLTLRGSVLPKVIPLMVLIGLYSAVMVKVWQMHLPVPIEVLGEVTGNVVYNLVLGLLLVFRTNSSYDRFWEGRKAWGDIVVSVRNLARTIQLCIPVANAEQHHRRQEILRLLTGFALATKLHLRDSEDTAELAACLTPEQRQHLDQSRNRPLQITLWIQDYLQQEFQQERIDTVRLLELNQFLNAMIQGLTTCERIRQTPIPPAYLIYLRRLILLYCLGLPLVLTPKLGWWSALVAMMVGFILFGIEELGQQIADPFGLDANDLPLDAICTLLGDNVKAIAAANAPDNTAPVPPAPNDSSLLQTH